MSGSFDLSSVTSLLGGGGVGGPVSKEFGRSSAENTLHGDTYNVGKGFSSESLLVIAAVVVIAGLVWAALRHK